MCHGTGVFTGRGWEEDNKQGTRTTAARGHRSSRDSGDRYPNITVPGLPDGTRGRTRRQRHSTPGRNADESPSLVPGLPAAHFPRLLENFRDGAMETFLCGGRCRLATGVGLCLPLPLGCNTRGSHRIALHLASQGMVVKGNFLFCTVRCSVSLAAWWHCCAARLSSQPLPPPAVLEKSGRRLFS